jgi:hypothetical protein
MRVVGEWFLCDDGVTRPTLHVKVHGAGSIRHSERFLVDGCADRTVLSFPLLNLLQLPTQPGPPGLALQGISGSTAFTVVATVLELTRDDGIPVHIRGTVAAFTDPLATELSILGRDVLNNFDVILSWPRKEILLLAPNHHYQVIRS